MITLSVVSLVTALLAQPQPQPPSPAVADQPADVSNDAAARLAIMRRSLLVFDIHPVDDREVRLRLQPEPIFRFTNPVGSSMDGGIFFWLGKDDRPEAAAQVSVSRQDGRWWQEFISLCPAPLIAESSDAAVPEWTPQRAGVELKPVPGAPRPAETAEQRLRQMRALMEDFTATDNFRGKSWQPLRLLVKPLARYGKPGTNLVDGALYGFVLATDPEACVALEARIGKDGPEWQYAFAPLSSYALKGLWKGQEVWSLPRRNGPACGPNKPFHQRIYVPGE